VCFTVELVNSQVVFKGTDTNGAVIVTASTTEIKGCQHKPQYKGGELVAKTSWVASLDNMQVSMHHLVQLTHIHTHTFITVLVHCAQVIVSC
jgi:hypothetical protein